MNIIYTEVVRSSNIILITLVQLESNSFRILKYSHIQMHPSHQNQPPPMPIKYKLPKNLCQSCFELSGRFIMDCYCIVCQQCYHSFFAQKNNQPVCPLCSKPTKHNKIDAKQQTSIKKISHLFQNVDIGLQRLLQVYKFQNQIVNRYCQYLEKQISRYQSAIGQLIASNPPLYKFFNGRVKMKKNSGQTQYVDRNSIQSIRGQSTVKLNRQYNSQIFQSRRTTLQMNPHENPPMYHHNGKSSKNEYIMNSKPSAQYSNIRPVGKGTGTNYSGNAVYKVPNINYNTAIRSSKRIMRGKIGNQYEAERYSRNPNQIYQQIKNNSRHH